MQQQQQQQQQQQIIYGGNTSDDGNASDNDYNNHSNNNNMNNNNNNRRRRTRITSNNGYSSSYCGQQLRQAWGLQTFIAIYCFNNHHSSRSCVGGPEFYQQIKCNLIILLEMGGRQNIRKQRHHVHSHAMSLVYEQVAALVALSAEQTLRLLTLQYFRVPWNAEHSLGTL